MIIDNGNNPQSPNNNKAQSIRERAINAYLGKQAAAAEKPVSEVPQVNATSVAPEEMGAIKAPASKAAESKEEKEHSDNSSESNVPKEASKGTEEPISSQFAQLAKKEKILRAQALELKRQREAFKAEQEAAAKPKQEAQAVDMSKFLDKDALKQNPDKIWETLQELGYSYDQLTQAALNAPNPVNTELKQLKAQMEAEIKAMREEQSRAQKAYEEQQQAAYKQAVDQIKADVKRLVDTDTSFEMIKATDSIDDVARLIEETFKEEKRLMTVEEAAKEVEEYLTGEAIKLAKLEKIQKMFKPASPEVKAETKSNDEPQKPQTKTLTNAMASQQRVSARERAIAAFTGRKN